MTVFMNDDAFIKKGFLISTNNVLIDVDLVYNYLNKDSYWAQGISRLQLENAIKNSLCFGVYKHGQQAGFARVVTDHATFAYICDVFIIPTFRKQGLSKWLIQSIVNYPSLQGLRRWSLATADAQGLYQKFGFSPITRPERWMEIFTPYNNKPL